MNWIGLLSIVGGSLFVVFILNKISPGLVSAFFSAIVQVFRFAIEHLPKPVKYAIAIILILTFGNMLVSYTIGLTKVCINNEVYDVSTDKGLLLNTISDIDELRAQVSVDKGGFDTANVYRLETVDDDVVLYVIAGLNEFPSIVGREQLRGLMPGDQFREVFGETLRDTSAQMRICYSKDDGSCVLRGRFNGNGISCGDPPYEDWDYTVGKITYQLKDVDWENAESGKLKGTFKIDFSKPFSELLPWRRVSIDDCGTSGGAVELDDMEDVNLFIKNGNTEYTLKVYDAGFVPVLVGKESDNETIYFETEANAGSRIANDIVSSEDEVKDGDVFTFACDTSTDYPFDVTMKVLGINIFNKTVLMMLFVISGILAIYAYLHNLM